MIKFLIIDHDCECFGTQQISLYEGSVRQKKLVNLLIWKQRWQVLPKRWNLPTIIHSITHQKPVTITTIHAQRQIVERLVDSNLESTCKATVVAHRRQYRVISVEWVRKTTETSVTTAKISAGIRTRYLPNTHRVTTKPTCSVNLMNEWICDYPRVSNI